MKVFLIIIYIFWSVISSIKIRKFSDDSLAAKTLSLKLLKTLNIDTKKLPKN